MQQVEQGQEALRQMAALNRIGRIALEDLEPTLPVLLANRDARELYRLEDLLPHSFTGRNFL